MKQIGTGLVLCALLAAVPVAAEAAVGQPRTAGGFYDRNPSVVQDGELTYLFFARSRLPCNRLAGCNADQQTYDLYYKVSPDGGKTYGPAVLLALNPVVSPVFYGRTVAAIRSVEGTSAGTIYVFWASGGNSSELFMLMKPPGMAFSGPIPVFTTPPVGVFNVEAVAGPDGMFLYTQECCVETGIYAYRFNGATAQDRTLVTPDGTIPKAIVDNQPGPFRYRMTYADASNYPTVDVYVTSSVDGLVWTAPELVVTEPGVSNWDPTLAQLPNGRYYLHFAPDAEEGTGRQRIAVTTSNDFERWSAPHEISPGFTGGIEYWDYWPEGFVLGNKLTLYYTSERGFDDNPTGTAHIWTLPGFSGVNEMPTGSAEASNDGFSPAGWRGIGDATWTEGGTDGTRSLATGPLGSWRSDPVAVQPGLTYGVMADVRGEGRVIIEQLTLTGTVLTGLTRVLSIASGAAFASVDDVVAIPAGVTAVRIRLTGSLLGTTSFDDVRVWKQ